MSVKKVIRESGRARMKVVPWVVVAAGVLTARVSSAEGAQCASLISTDIPFTTITAVEAITGGSFTPPGSTTAITDLPEFCRVALNIAPSSDSSIRAEVWLPTTSWNDRFLGTGNGGFAGSIRYDALANAVKRGYVGANTDMGTAITGGTVALAGHPEKFLDYFPRSTHYMTVAAKTLINAFYGDRPKYSYFQGCSTGGAQGVAEAQIYPNDYDGILAGTPGYNRTHIIGALVYNWTRSNTAPATRLDSAKLALLNAAVLKSCTSAKALPSDPFLTDPKKCDFDPQELACTADNPTNCLTAGEILSARYMYEGMINPRTGARIFPGWERGTELGWGSAQSTRLPSYGVVEWTLGVPPSFAYDPFTVDWSTAMDRINATSGVALNPASSDLSRFAARGGKLIAYYGQTDGLGHYADGVNYFYRLAAELNDHGRDGHNKHRDNRRHGPESITDRELSRNRQVVNEYARLFLVPGGGHCPSNHDAFSSLVDWVEKGVAPRTITASYTLNGVPATRPLCPFPKQPRYNGSGDANVATNWSCVNAADKPIDLPAPEYIQALQIRARAEPERINLKRLVKQSGKYVEKQWTHDDHDADAYFTITLDTFDGPESFRQWAPSGLKVEGAPAVKTTLSKDGRVLRATFRKSDIVSFTGGESPSTPVELTVSGTVVRYGIPSLFAAGATVTLRR